MSDVKTNQEDNTPATGDIQPVESATKAVDTKATKVTPPKAKTNPVKAASKAQVKTPVTGAKTEIENKETKTLASMVEKPNANTEKRKSIAKGVFERNDNLYTLFFTSDFVPFKTEADALKHADSLSDKIVTPITKED